MAIRIGIVAVVLLAPGKAGRCGPQRWPTSQNKSVALSPTIGLPINAIPTG